MFSAGIHETTLAQIAATIGEALAGDWFEDWIGSVSMAVAAGVVVAEDQVADRARHGAMDRVQALQQVCSQLWNKSIRMLL